MPIGRIDASSVPLLYLGEDREAGKRSGNGRLAARGEDLGLKEVGA